MNGCGTVQFELHCCSRHWHLPKARRPRGRMRLRVGGAWRARRSWCAGARLRCALRTALAAEHLVVHLLDLVGRRLVDLLVDSDGSEHPQVGRVSAQTSMSVQGTATVAMLMGGTTRCGISIPSSAQAKVVFSRWRRSFSLESRRCPRVPPLRSWIGGGEGPPIPSSRGAPSRAPGPAMPPSPPGAFTGRTGPLPVYRVRGPLACLPEFSCTIHAFAAHPSSLLSAQLELRGLDNSVSLTIAPHVSQVCFRPDFPAPTSRPRFEKFSSAASTRRVLRVEK